MSFFHAFLWQRQHYMIRFRLKERIADLSFSTGHRITLDQVAAGTGIHRVTLSRLGSQKGYNTTTDVLDRLCKFFNCPIEQLVEYLPDDAAQAADEG